MASHPALASFDVLPLSERLFVRARLASSPLLELARRVRGDRVLDIGCGHGLLGALVLWEAPTRVVTGVDPDPRKVAWARASVGRTGRARFEVGTVQSLVGAEARAYDTVAIADVLYLLPEVEQAALLRACRAFLTPEGSLLILASEDDGGWRTVKALWQERLMVQLLGRTRSSGALGLHTREAMLALLSQAGFRIEEVVPLAQGYTTPHVLYACRPRRDDGGGA